MERKISQFMFCLLDKGSRLFFKYVKRKIHQVTFGKIDLNNSFLQNDINPWSTEDVRTEWMTQKPLNTIFPQDTVKKWQRILPTWFHCLLAGLGVSMPILAQSSQKCNSSLVLCLPGPAWPSPGRCHRALGSQSSPAPGLQPPPAAKAPHPPHTSLQAQGEKQGPDSDQNWRQKAFSWETWDKR